MKQDSSWRRIIDLLLPEFVAFYFPQIHRDVDFARGFEFLDKELQKILPQDDDSGKRVVDKLVKVFLRDGSEKWLLIHIEVQGYQERDFARRVYHCNYRISDRFGEEVISVALLTDDNPDFRECIYSISRWGFRLHFEFPVVKLLDYREQWDALEGVANPFAMATMAFLKTVETQGLDHERYQWKRQFLLAMYGKGSSREMVLALYEFIDVVMALPEADDEALYEEIKQTVEERKMSVLTTAERIGMKRGIQQGIEQGIEQGLKEAISDILEIKFGTAGMALFDAVAQVSHVETLRKIRNDLKHAKTIADAEESIRAHTVEKE